MNRIIKKQKEGFFNCGIIWVIIIMLAFFVQSCSQENDFPEMSLNENEKSLNLTAPNGEKIISGISALKEEVALVVANRFGIDKAFSILSIEYLPLDEGYSAIINYKTFDGTGGNLVKTNSSFYPENTRIRNLQSSIRLKSGNEGGNGSSRIYSCTRLGNCACWVTAVYLNGAITYTCGDCESCELKITDN